MGRFFFCREKRLKILHDKIFRVFLDKGVEETPGKLLYKCKINIRALKYGKTYQTSFIDGFKCCFNDGRGRIGLQDRAKRQPPSMSKKTSELQNYLPPGNLGRHITKNSSSGSRCITNPMSKLSKEKFGIHMGFFCVTNMQGICTSWNVGRMFV